MNYPISTSSNQHISTSLHDVVASEDFRIKYDTTYGAFDPVVFFMSLNHMVPTHRVIRNITRDQAVIENFREEFSVGDHNVMFDFEYLQREQRFNLRQGLMMVVPDLLVYFDLKAPDTAARVYHTHLTDRALLESVFGFFINRQQSRTGNGLGLLVQDPSCGLYVKKFALKDPQVDLGLCYNDDLVPVHETILERLSRQDAKGIVLLHGQPGTGKTTYIRHLASVLGKPMIFIPPDLAPQVASPEFLALMVDHPGSILVIEDAESVIRDRVNDENLSVANLLNISDGLLSDCLSIQLICTFNTDLSRIDKALLRKGRIIARYEFGALTWQKAEALSSTLGFSNTVSRDMTLAEIYHHSEVDYGAPAGKKIGFRAA